MAPKGPESIADMATLKMVLSEPQMKIGVRLRFCEIARAKNRLGCGGLYKAGVGFRSAGENRGFLTVS